VAAVNFYVLSVAAIDYIVLFLLLFLFFISDKLARFFIIVQCQESGGRGGLPVAAPKCYPAGIKPWSHA